MANICKNGSGYLIGNYLTYENNLNWTHMQRVNKNGKILGGRFYASEITLTNTYYRIINSMGICLFCGDIDWRHLEEHHPDKEKLPNFTVTLCANCHKETHWNNGSLTEGAKKGVRRRNEV